MTKIRLDIHFILSINISGYCFFKKNLKNCPLLGGRDSIC